MTPLNRNLKQLPNWLWVIPILLLANILIAHHLTTDAYWFDELANFRKMGVSHFPSLSPSDVIYKLGVNRWPPAYNIVLYVWGFLVGWSEVAIRSLSLFMGVISVAMMYRLGITYHSRRVGLISVLLFSTSAFLIFYSHEARGYIQYLFLTTIVLYQYWHYSKKARITRTESAVFIAISIVLIYTHYVALYIMVVLGIYHLFLASRTKQWAKQLVLLIIVGISYLPWAFIAVVNAISETTMDRGLDPLTIIETIFYGFGNGLWFILLPLIIYPLIFVRSRATWMLVFSAVLFLMGAFITNIFTDFLFHIRHLIGLLPILLLLSAIAIDHMLTHVHKIAWVVVIMWMGLGIVINRDLAFMENLPGALETRPLEMLTTTHDITSTCATENDFVVTHLASQQNIWNAHVEKYYLWQADYTLVMIDNMVDFSDAEDLDTLETIGSYDSRLQDYLENTNRVWVMVADDAYVTPNLDKLGVSFADNYAYCDRVYQGSEMSVYIYQQDSEFSCQSEFLSTQSLPSCIPNLLNNGTNTTNSQ